MDSKGPPCKSHTCRYGRFGSHSSSPSRRGIMGDLRCCKELLCFFVFFGFFFFFKSLTVLISTDSALALVNRKVKTWPERRVGALRFRYSKRTVRDFSGTMRRSRVRSYSFLMAKKENGFSEIHISEDQLCPFLWPRFFFFFITEPNIFFFLLSLALLVFFSSKLISQPR